ncbi:MAG: hypothetical protein F4204_09220 [Rhodospirillaceae bacterium]|nr:hypothetical protein [Rhodospirillaceae bacterium]
MAYQIAILFAERHAEDANTIDKEICGRNTGLSHSVAQYVAREIFQRIRARRLVGNRKEALAAFVRSAHEPHPLEGTKARPMLEGAPDVGNNEIRRRQRAIRIKDKFDRVRRAVVQVSLLSTDMSDCLSAVEPPISALVQFTFLRQIGYDFRALPIAKSRKFKGNTAPTFDLAQDVRLRRVALGHRSRDDTQTGALCEFREHLEFQVCLFEPVSHVPSHRIVIDKFGSCPNADGNTIVVLESAWSQNKHRYCDINTSEARDGEEPQLNSWQ